MADLPEPSRAPEACSRLLRTLLDAAPQRVKLDYFELCGVDRVASFPLRRVRSDFDRLAAFILVLVDQNLARGDHYADVSGTYFWDLELTPSGMRAVESLHRQGVLDRGPSDRDLVAELCPEPARTDRG